MPRTRRSRHAGNSVEKGDDVDGELCRSTTVAGREGVDLSTALVHEQETRLDQVPPRVAEAISLYTDEEPETVEVTLDVDLAAVGLNADESQAVHEAERLREELEALDARVRTATLESARVLANHGLSVRDTGALLGVSHQRVHQLLGGTARDGRPLSRPNEDRRGGKRQPAAPAKSQPPATARRQSSGTKGR